MHRISFAMTVPVALSLAGVLHAQTSVAADTTDSLHTRPTFTTTTTFSGTPENKSFGPFHLVGKYLGKGENHAEGQIADR